MVDRRGAKRIPVCHDLRARPVAGRSSFRCAIHVADRRHETECERLRGIDARVFLEVTHEETRERRRVRNRDIDAPVIDQILAIEHDIIVEQAEQADIVIDRDFEAPCAERAGVHEPRSLPPVRRARQRGRDLRSHLTP